MNKTMNKMNFITKFACKLVGWNPSLLSECSEASYRTLKKYMSAILILGFIWGTIGYLFAGRYVGIESIFGKSVVALVFVLVIVCIERFIILKIGKSVVTAAMRIILALLMATLGATIFDQMIFKSDIEVKLKESRDEMANEAIARRSGIIDEDFNRISLQRDSVQAELLVLYQKINEKPFITVTDVETTKIPNGKDENGKDVYVTQSQVTKTNAPNPLNAQAKLDEETLKTYEERLKELRAEKVGLSESVRKEYADANVGFLEELKVLFRYIIFEDSIAAIFYLCLFLFMMSLEILVVSSRFGEKPCDYDVLVEHQLNVKSATLRKTEENLVSNR